MDKILKVLIDLKRVLDHKQKSYKGVVGNQATVEARDNLRRKITELQSRIDEVNDAIEIRKKEIGLETESDDGSIDGLGIRGLHNG